MIRDGIVEAIQLLISGDSQVFDAALRSVWVSIFAVLLASLFGISFGIVLARKKIWGHQLLILAARVGMSVPTVLIGLLLYAVFSRRGVLGPLELLYTPTAIVIGEFFLALPIITSLTHAAVSRLPTVAFETAKTLGAGPIKRALVYLNEARLAIVLAILTAFSRCFTELGIAMMVGGNLAGRTRTLTTATALETARGEFARGMAMCFILVLIAIITTICIALMSRTPKEQSNDG